MLLISGYIFVHVPSQLRRCATVMSILLVQVGPSASDMLHCFMFQVACLDACSIVLAVNFYQFSRESFSVTANNLQQTMLSCD
jgi:hypothetical protein